MSVTFRLSAATVWLTPLLLALSLEAFALDADAIVAQADRIRFPQTGFQVDVAVRTESGGVRQEVYQYRVLSQSNEATIVMTVAPPAERGNILLMKGSDLWAFLPNVSQPVRLPLSQKLTGQVSNGDLARTNLAGDYRAELIGREHLAGKDTHVLDLEAARSGVTYHRVKYWVEMGTYRPVKAEFYTRSGRMLKEAWFDAYQEMGGALRPARMTLYDKLRGDEKSVMVYANMKLRALADKLFTKDYLKKLQ